MGQFDSMMAQSAPAMLEAAGDRGALTYKTPDGGGSFTWDCHIGPIRGDLQQMANGDIVKVMRCVASGLASSLIENGVEELQAKAAIEAAGYDDWSIDLQESRWGHAVVQLGLVRRPVSTLRNMETNAPV